MRLILLLLEINFLWSSVDFLILMFSEPGGPFKRDDQGKGVVVVDVDVNVDIDIDVDAYLHGIRWWT